MSSRVRLIALVFAASALACTVDDPQVNDVGAVVLRPVNPSIVTQSVSATPGGTIDGNRMQAAFWKITRAELNVGDVCVNLLLTDGEPSACQSGGDPPDCKSADTSSGAAINLGDCLEFLVVESFDANAAVQATLVLDFEARLKRVTPVVVPLIGDFDGDGVLNGNDNCLLLANADQKDTGGLGIGDACRVVDIFSGVLLDSDADGVADFRDNCVHIANPLQVNPPTSDSFSDIESAISDGIGLACEADPLGMTNNTGFEEQIIDIGPESVSIPFEFVLPSSQGFVVIDFNDELVFPACEWSQGACSGFDADAIQACIRTSTFDASLGCS